MGDSQAKYNIWTVEESNELLRLMYQSRLKWFKQRYNNYCKLMRHSSGFGWDSMTKKFTASDEVWEDYFKSHPKHEHYRTDTFEDYEDLRLPLFSEDLASPLPSQPMSSEVPQATRKRDRSEFEAKSSTSKNIDPDVLNRLSYTIEKASSKIELVGVADDNCWDAIKQVPNLDNRTHYKALDWLNTRAKKVAFLKMTIEERLEGIDFKMSE
ncbi:uncharacterized protein At2g29880-like [Zingiber officinale]|uniref:uncharacterized protein At2g29880-like n=1 Tax=Zingiber officinale TaxID=94328 RepID=UPI001C4CAD72|nr:uncharacterized protein At2g29880-like [Zingiber officinale]